MLGHFYTLELPDAGHKPSRSVLEIKSKSAPRNDEPDAVFVMMNPGSSKPLNQTASLREGDVGSSPSKVLVLASSDTTQYQLMRVMREQGWIYVRVINLSDLIDTQSGSFVRCFPEVEKATGNFVHSIFAPERAEELARKLRRMPGAPVVCAWGVSEKLKPLTDRAMDRLASEEHVIGIAKPGSTGKYFHPLQRPQAKMEEWVAQLLAVLPHARALPINAITAFRR